MNLRTTFLLFGLIITLISCEKTPAEKGLDLYQKKKFKEAIKMFDEFLETHPKDADTYFNRGRSYEQLGDLETAIADYQTAVDIDPTNEIFWLSSGIANFRLEKYEATISNADGLLEIQENNGQALVLKARAQTKLKRLADAMDTLELAIKKNGKNKDAYLYRGLIRAQAKDKDACDDLERAKQLGAKNAIELLNKYCE